jgi:hypothetical protein
MNNGEWRRVDWTRYTRVTRGPRKGKLRRKTKAEMLRDRPTDDPISFSTVLPSVTRTEEKEGTTRPGAHANSSESLEKRVGEWVKGFAFQFIGLLVWIPLGILCGFSYGGGLIVRVLLPIAFVFGILVLVFRFVRAMATALWSGKPVSKDWYE